MNGRSDGLSEDRAAAAAEARGDVPDVVALADLPPLGGTGRADSRLVEVAHAYGREHADHFAGVLLAQGHLWVGFTADAQVHLEELRSRVADPSLLRAFVAEYTEQELRALQAVITADMGRLREEGVKVAMVAVSVPRNRVEVGIEDDSDAAVEVLRRRYGADKVVVSTGVQLRPVGGQK